MTKRKFMTMLMIGGAAVYALNSNKAQPETKPPDIKPAFVIVNDDSGVLSEPERAKETRLLMLAQMKALNGRRNYANAPMHVISTSYGRLLWAGKVNDLRTERAADLVAKMETQPANCSKLEEAFKSTRDAIRQLEQQGYNRIHVYFFSSLISTPSPCKEVTTIDLPQPPVPLKYDELLASNDAVFSVTFLWVNPHQKRLYMQVLQPVADWASANGKTFALYDMEETAFQLRSGLPGVPKR